MVTVSEPATPILHQGAHRFRRMLTVLFTTLVCMLGIHSDVSAFSPGKGLPAGVPDMNHPGTYVEVLKTNSLANGIEKNKIAIHVVDEFGVPVEGATVGVFIGDVANSGTTDPNGIWVYDWGYRSPGAVRVEVYVNNKPMPIAKNPETHFIATSPEVGVNSTYLKVIDDLALANNTARNRVQAHVTDAWGKALKDVPIKFTIESGTADPKTPLTGVTDASGNYYLDLVSLVAGKVKISAEVVGVGKILPDVEVEFVADVPSPAKSELLKDDDQALANDADLATVKAHIVDANGNPVKFKAVQFSIQPGGTATTATLVPVNGVVATDEFGIAIISIKSPKTGTAQIIAQVDGQPITKNSPQTVTFIADVPATNNPQTRLVVLTNYAPADGTTSNRVRAVIRDALGNPVPNATIVFSLVSGVGTLASPVTVVTDAAGHAIIRITSTQAGVSKIYATVNNLPIQFDNPIDVVFVADNPSAAESELFKLDDEAVGNDVDFATVRAHIVDKNGNPVNNQEVIFAIEPGGTATAAHLANLGKATTDPSGNAIISIRSPMIGTARIIAYLNGVQITKGSYQLVTFIADKPATNNPLTRLIVLVNESPADGTTVNVVRAVIRDALGNPVQGATIVFSVSSGVGTIKSSTTVVTDASGHAVVSITSTAAGKGYIYATVNGDAIQTNNPAEVVFVADDPSTSNPFTALLEEKKTAKADNADYAIVKAHIVDANGNPVNNKNVNFFIDGGTAALSAALNPADGIATTNATGDAYIRIKSSAVGTVIINASVNGSPILVGKDQVVTFVAGDPNMGHPSTFIEVTQDNAVANNVAENIVRVHLVDTWGNPVANKAVEFSLGSGTATFVGSEIVQTNAAGDAFIRLKSTVAGQVSITAMVGTETVINKSPAIATFIAGPPDLTKLASTLSEVIKKAPANGTSITSVKAHLVDAFNNPVPKYDVTFSWTGAANAKDGIITIATDENGNAVIEFTSTVAGKVQVTAKVNGSPIQFPAPAGMVEVEFTVDVPSTGNPSTRIWAVIPEATANGVAHTEVRAHVEDAQGNLVPNATVVFEIKGGSAQFEGGVFTVTTDANGEASVFLVSTIAGSVQVTAKVGTDPVLNGSPVTVKFVAGDPSADNLATELIVLIKQAVADDIAVTSVKAHIADAFGNAVNGASVLFVIKDGTAVIKEINPVITGPDGNAVITLHSAIVGKVTIEAVIQGPVPENIKKGSPAEVEFILGPPSNEHASTYIAVVTDNAKADGTELNKVKVKVVDAGGHALKDATIEFTIESGTATIVETAPILTDANGEAYITLYSTVAGKVKILAKADGVKIEKGSPAIVTFVAGTTEPTNKSTELVVVSDKASANGIATNSVKVRVADFYGNAVPGVPVVFTVATGTATIVEAGPFVTDEKGEVIITLTSKVGGSVDITATADGLEVIHGKPATIIFVSDPDVTNPETKLIVVSNDAIADGVETNSVKAHVVDANGTPLNLKEVFFRIESGDATVLTVQPVLTDANGDATILLASKTAGPVTVTAKVIDKPIVFGSPAKLRFVPIDIYVPKVFTPNSDGKNDVAKPIVVGLTTFHYFSIYNRWGNLLFTTKDPNMGWDGRFKGILQPVETYLWIAEGLDKDKKKVVRRGMISLVR